MQLHLIVRVRQRGFTLIEVLVATVILAFGLLGIAGLQLTGIRANQSSFYRSQAVNIMTDLAERMKNNPLGTKGCSAAQVAKQPPPPPCTTVVDPQYAGFNSNGYACAAPTICSQENGSGTPPNCNSTQIAAYDKFVIACGLPDGTGARVGGVAALLPSGRVQVDCIDAAGAVTANTVAACQPGFRQRIRVFWQDRGDINSANVNAVTTNVEMWVQP